MEAHLNGLKFFYTDTDNTNDPPIVFIHGFPFSHQMWQAQVELLEPQFRVITYDNRGHGQSDVGDGQYFLEFFVDDLIALLNHLELPKVILCGLSMGGYIALRAVERNPERVRALVLCDTRSEADSNEAKLKRAAGIKSIQNEGISPFAENFLKGAFAPQSFQTRPATIEAIRQIILANPAPGICGSLLALATRTDTTLSLPRIHVPTLILVGEQDALTPPTAAKNMHDQIRNSEFHVIPDAGHMSNLENPTAFNGCLKAFLQKLG